ncbi:hypothetical protein, partial [Pseudomonas brassicacearum]|uniref:hypothetical protein n=1 Tax=Pseudomonas brassicacearum TaxID=930166 RepID=UPI001ADDD1D7
MGARLARDANTSVHLIDQGDAIASKLSSHRDFCQLQLCEYPTTHVGAELVGARLARDANTSVHLIDQGDAIASKLSSHRDFCQLQL